MRPVTSAEIEELLRFPRASMRTRLPLREACPHATNYDLQDPACARCAQRQDCRWLAFNDELGCLDLESVAEVVRVLEDVCAQAQCQVTVLRHRGCSCSTCRFLKRTKLMLKRVEQAGLAGVARSGVPALTSP